MVSKLVFLMILSWLLVYLAIVQSNKMLEEFRIQCGDRCIEQYVSNIETSSAVPFYKQCLTECNEESAK